MVLCGWHFLAHCFWHGIQFLLNFLDFHSPLLEAVKNTKAIALCLEMKEEDSFLRVFFFKNQPINGDFNKPLNRIQFYDCKAKLEKANIDTPQGISNGKGLEILLTGCYERM